MNASDWLLVIWAGVVPAGIVMGMVVNLVANNVTSHRAKVQGEA